MVAERGLQLVSFYPTTDLETAFLELTRGGTLTLWRLELLRLVHTHRWMIVFGVYGFFAVTGPLMARYFNEIIARFGGTSP